MPLSVPAIVVAIFCLTCDINEALITPNATIPGPILPLPTPTTVPKALPYLKPIPVPSYNVPPVRQESVNGVESQPEASIIAVKLPSLRQEMPTPVQGMISTLTSMVGGLVPFIRRPETASAAEPVEKLPNQVDEPNQVDVPKKADKPKQVHLDHEHVNKPAESLPDGVVADGFFYEGQKANGEYFNEEMPASVALEVHSHEEDSSPGKLYDDKSEHPYYVVDKPAEGPAPPPLVYFTSGLRSDDASVAAWSEYYAKLRRYNEYYFPSYRRSGRAKNGKTNDEVEQSVESENQILDVAKKSDD